jgi:hypothetical protein
MAKLPLKSVKSEKFLVMSFQEFFLWRGCHGNPEWKKSSKLITRNIQVVDRSKSGGPLVRLKRWEVFW